MVTVLLPMSNKLHDSRKKFSMGPFLPTDMVRLQLASLALQYLLIKGIRDIVRTCLKVTKKAVIYKLAVLIKINLLCNVLGENQLTITVTVLHSEV